MTVTRCVKPGQSWTYPCRPAQLVADDCGAARARPLPARCRPAAALLERRARNARPALPPGTLRPVRRLLHHLLCALRGVQPDEALLAFLRADELLVDMGRRRAPTLAGATSRQQGMLLRAAGALQFRHAIP